MANGLFGGGNGTEQSPYLIEDAHDINAIRNVLAGTARKYFKLVNNIDMNIAPYNEGVGFVPLKSTATYDVVTFMGNNKTINNLFINFEEQYSGLFAYLNSSTISNVILRNPVVKGRDRTGTIVGYSTGVSSFVNVVIENPIIEGTSFVGGMAGLMNSVNMNSCSIKNAKIKGSNSDIGTMAGRINGGNISNNIAHALECIGSNGNVSGFCGSIAGSNSKFNNNIAITEYLYTSVSTPPVNGFTREISGYTGNTFTDCFYNSTLISSSDRGTGKTTIELKSPATYTGWNGNIWDIKEGKYPNLQYVKSLITDKTLILHEGEYKKWNPQQDATVDIYSENTIPIMTTNTNPSGLAFIDTQTSDSYRASYAFDRQVNTLAESNNRDGFIGYKFTIPKKINAYSIQIGSLAYSISNWRFQGSTDTTNGADGVWEDLHAVNYTFTASENKTFYFSNDKEYIAYRIKLAKAPTESLYSDFYEIGFYEKLSDGKPEVKPHWSTVSTTLSSSQFLEQGMDNLSPLLDRKVTTLEPMSMIDKSEILGVGEIGKVFNKTIDLKKYFDIRSIRTEVK
ncbi:hypothetical protein [Lysinibacillus sp. LK3]|uniref:hypothetical protein n=1 Tax=Lysinibacillus sp. LK3 TaxID=1628207 RepID=UPI000652DF51|nr:hypothetical protein [Lysinibacillus sp. LK3]KMN41544.1 hypothetical protein VK91_00275 [Lysinibacillus sp. LK3]